MARIRPTGYDEVDLGRVAQDDSGAPEPSDEDAGTTLDAAVAILTRWGWESVTTANVAEESGLDQSVVDAIWPDRNQLVREAVWAVAVQAAIDLLTSEGWDAITQARVAERSGLGRATIYRYWPRREDLVHAAVASHMTIRSHIEPSGDLASDLKDELHHLATEQLDRRLNTILGTIIARSEFEEDHRKLKHELHLEGNSTLRAVVADGIARGQLRADTDPDDAVSFLIGPVVYRGLVSEEALDKDFTDWIVTTFLESHRAAKPRRQKAQRT